IPGDKFVRRRDFHREVNKALGLGILAAADDPVLFAIVAQKFLVSAKSRDRIQSIFRKFLPVEGRTVHSAVASSLYFFLSCVARGRYESRIGSGQPDLLTFPPSTAMPASVSRAAHNFSSAVFSTRIGAGP